jgi:transposase
MIRSLLKKPAVRNGRPAREHPAIRNVQKATGIEVDPKSWTKKDPFLRWSAALKNRGESMPKTRKNHPPSLKAKVAVEAIKAHKTAAQIAQMFGVHPTQVGGWKKQALAGLPDVFGNGRQQLREQSDAEKDELYKQIGQLKVELDFLKKRAGLIG